MLFLDGCRPRPRRAFAVLLVAALASGCGDDSGPSSQNLANFVSTVAPVAGGANAVLQQGSAPAAGSGPSVAVVGGSTVINGGSAQVTLTGSGPFTTAVIYVDGVEDYYRLTLAQAVSTIDLLLTVAQEVPEQTFSLRYAVGSGTSSVGAYAAVGVSVIEVGAGEVQVSVSWNAASDVDLHLVEPGGEEVYYGDAQSATGGTLDLDSNAGCAIDNKNNENITWANAPSGSYTVRVDYWASCGVAQTDYVVTVQRQDAAPQTFTGSFTGLGDNGGAGSGTDITTFTF